MSVLTRAVVTLLAVAFADGLAFTPALFSARYRTPRHLAAALVIAGVIACIVVSVAVAL